jgi:SAM-dependent methyltransferase
MRRSGLALYGEELRAAAAGGPLGGLRVRYSSGPAVTLDVSRWCGPLLPGDEGMLSRCAGPALDVGCGPGRLVRALAARGVPALGIDLEPAAVGLARARGASAVTCSVFAPVPRAGSWRVALLADVAVGIGGDPPALLRRVSSLLRSGGELVCELDPPGGGVVRVRARLEAETGEVSSWFPWAHVAADAVAGPAAAAGLQVHERWSEEGRWFAVLSAA